MRNPMDRQFLLRAHALPLACWLAIAVHLPAMVWAAGFRCDRSLTSAAVPEWIRTCTTRPTSTKTLLRREGGKFKDPRPKESNPEDAHDGIDVMLEFYNHPQCTNEKLYAAEDLAVRAIAPGTVAYSRVNSGRCPSAGCTDPLMQSGLGFTVIIDHGNGVYSLYAHLADDLDELRRQCLGNSDSLATSGATMPVQVGDTVAQGQTIGYLGEVTGTTGRFDGPTGNAVRTDVPSQVHIEIFQAAQGRRSSGSIADIVAPEQRGLIDPTAVLASRFPDYFRVQGMQLQVR